jgi:ketosteroid isomerase-like protein
MLDRQKLIIEAVCAAWEAGHPAGIIAHFADDAEFWVHSPPNAASFIGRGRGKAELGQRLHSFLGSIKVMYYEPMLPMAEMGRGALRCRARFVYRHRIKCLEIDGTMRHIWRFRGDKVARLDVFYDALQMSAFYGLVDCVEA